MIKFLVFLVILVILFGVETTRALVFGGASIIGLAILGLIAVVFLIYVYDALRDKRTPEQKAKEKEIEKQKNKEAMAANKKALSFWFWAIFIITAVVIVGSLTVLLILTK